MREPTPDRDHWREDAECLRTGAKFHWNNAPEDPNSPTVLNALAFCANCCVVEQCAQDAADTGELYPYQVRAGRRFWTSERGTLPDPTTPLAKSWTSKGERYSRARTPVRQRRTS